MKYLYALMTAMLLTVSHGASGSSYGPYQAALVRAVDGDTVIVDVDLWPGLAQRVSVRLSGINAPELHARTDCERIAAQKALEAVQTLTAIGPLVLTDIGPDKYWGRIGGKIWVITGTEKIDLGQALIKRGLARPYSGGKRSPWCME